MRRFQTKEQHVQSHEIVIVHEVLGETSSILVLLLRYEGGWAGNEARGVVSGR